jgi:hypothetical protein
MGLGWSSGARPRKLGGDSSYAAVVEPPVADASLPPLPLPAARQLSSGVYRRRLFCSLCYTSSTIVSPPAPLSAYTPAAMARKKITENELMAPGSRNWAILGKLPRQLWMILMKRAQTHDKQLALANRCKAPHAYIRKFAMA